MSSTKHKWKRLADTKEVGEPVHKNWECVKCGCKKVQGNYKFSSPVYVRSGCFFDEFAPLCTEMGRTSNEPLD